MKDDDGCPDTGGKTLVVVLDPEHKPRLQIAAGDKLAPGSATLRAIALEMNHHRDWTLLVAAHAAKSEAGLERAAAIAYELDRLTHREVAEASAWDGMKKEPATTSDVKIVIVAPGGESGSVKKAPVPTPLPPAAKP